MTSVAQQKAIAILPKFSAFFSACGSSFIVYDILCSHSNVQSRKSNLSSRSASRCKQRRTLRNSAYYRLMLAMSISDFITSIAWFFTTWPIPSDANSPGDKMYGDEVYGDEVYGNSGTMQTCTAQAFFLQLGIITPFYNALLACYYYLTIRRQWKEKEFRLKVEYAGHFVSIAFGLGTSIAALVMKLYNNSTVWCWIAPYPFPTGCGNGPDQIPCERGHNANTYRWAFYYVPLWVMIVLVIIFMALVYAYVRSLDVKMSKYTESYENGASENTFQNESGDTITNRRRSLMYRRQKRRNERSKAVANQGLFYAGTFAFVWSFGTITRAMQLANAKPPWAITFLFAIFTPSQGFFNFLVYIRPRVIKYFTARKKSRLGSAKESCANILHVSGMSEENPTIEQPRRSNSGRFKNGKFNNSDLELELNDPMPSTHDDDDDDDDKEGNEEPKPKNGGPKVRFKVINDNYKDDSNGTNGNNTVLFEDIIKDSNVEDVEDDGDGDKSNPSVEEVESSHIATEEEAGEEETPTKVDTDLSFSW